MNKFIKIFILLVSFNFVSSSEFESCSIDDDISDEESLPVIDIRSGQIQGLKRETSKGHTFYSFKGIPYAEPPVGELRFRDPVPVHPWRGIRNASDDGNKCPQFGLLNDSIQGDEDCLFLNVYTPDISCRNVEKYPVVIYIHGGGFTLGSGLEESVPPSIYLNNDVVFVSVNYRLNIFGFLSLDTPEVPGNAALKDIQLAIKWVNDNIKYFNGDVDNISLHGMSAGSAAVEYQLLNPKSEGLFQKASMQSGAVLSSWSRPRSQEKSLEKLTTIIETSNDPEEILNNLNEKTTEELLLIYKEVKDIEIIKSGLIFTPFGPVIEKSFPNVEAFITEDPLELYKAGDFIKVPVLITLCRDEGNFFQFIYGTMLMSEIMEGEFADFMSFVNIDDKDEVNKKLFELYSGTDISKAEVANEFLSDLMFVVGINQALKYIVRDNTNEHYSYLFSFNGIQKTPIFPHLSGSPHGSDVSYLMFRPEISLSAEEVSIRKYLEAIHMSFIKNGKPSAPDTTWEPITEESFNVLKIDGIDNSMEPFPFADRMEYWNKFFV